MNSAGRCPCEIGPNPCLSCDSGAPDSPGTTMGVRPGMKMSRHYSPSLVPDRGRAYQPGGYLARGYDTGRPVATMDRLAKAK